MIAMRQEIVSRFAFAGLVSAAFIVGVMWLIWSPVPVYACSCVQPGSPSEELEKFSAVFAGRVVSVQHSYDPEGGIITPDDHFTIGFKVSAVWKGSVHEDMYITTPLTDGACGFTFDVGEEYIVYAYDSSYDDGGYTTGICSRTGLLGNAEEDLDELGPGDAPLTGTGGPAPDPTKNPVREAELPSTGGYNPQAWTLALAGGIGAAALVVGLVLLVRGRRLSRPGAGPTA